MEIHRNYPCHPRNCKKGRPQAISFLVLHYVGAEGGAEANAQYYGSVPGIEASAHYFVDHGPHAEVWASVPEGDTAWHCGRADGKYKHPQCRNANSIGIEMCCHQRPDGSWYMDLETVDQAAELSRDIMARYGIPVNHVLRHFDVTGKPCPQPWVDDPKAWETFKRRLEEIDVTREEIQAMVDEAVRVAQPQVYTSIAEVPLWARRLVERAVGAGALHGDDKGRLNLTIQDLKDIQRLDNLNLIP